jgi:hypothetical protein
MRDCFRASGCPESGIRWTPGTQSAPSARFRLPEIPPKNPMSSLAAVPVFYLDQDASWQAPCREVSRIEARRLKQAGAGVFIEHGRAFRLKESAPPPPCGFLPGTLETAATISLSEIQANVGIAPTPNLVIRAQQKIRAYPNVFDQLACLARGAWVRPQVQISVQ